MSEQEIIEKNKIIAEFMGVKFNPLDNFYYYGELMHTIPLLEPNVWRLSSDQLKYHSSWDWLMPVVEKIESLEHITDEGNWGPYHFNLYRTSTSFGYGRFKIIATEQQGSTKLEAAYKAVVQFIKWYNTK